MKFPQYSDISYFVENVKNPTIKSFLMCKKVSRKVGEK